MKARPAFNQPLNTWDTSKVTGMHAMFQGTNAPLLNLASWNTGEVRSTAYMFQGTSFNGLIGGWDVSKVEDFEYMFEGNPSFNQDISSWVVTSATFDDAHVSRGDGFLARRHS